MPVEKQGWWLSELDSLGIKPKKINVLNDTLELGNLTDNIKQTFFQDYQSCYSVDNNNSDEDCLGSFK